MKLTEFLSLFPSFYLSPPSTYKINDKRGQRVQKGRKLVLEVEERVMCFVNMFKIDCAHVLQGEGMEIPQ